MIQPTVGRIVWYRPHGARDQSQPRAAIVTCVHSDRMVNLAVFTHGGHIEAASSVTLLQDGDERPADSMFCEWMPYQKGQAAKTEALEKAAAK